MASTSPVGTPFQPLEPGDPAVLGGYEIRARLGAGGMGQVYLGVTATRRRLAVKVVRPELVEDPEFHRRFRREVDAAQRVRGLFTAAVIDADPDGPRPWLATEYVPGPSLATVVAEHGPLPPASVGALVAGVAEALQSVHRAGLVHRDLKASNVLLGPEGPCVIDFGVARAVDATSLTRSGRPVGTPQYMAPEQARGETATPATDVWALGVLAYVAATGRRPFGSGNESALLYRVVHEEPDLAGCPDYLRHLVAACLAKDPALRPDLRSVLAAPLGTGASPIVLPSSDWLPAELRRTVAAYDVTPERPMIAPAAPVALAAPAGGRPPRRRTPRALRAVVAAGALAVVGAGIGAYLLTRGDGGSDPPGGDGSDSSQPGGTPAPGTYAMRRELADDGTWRLVLTDIEVAADGSMTAHVDYRNHGAAALLSCALSPAADASRVEYADGTEASSTATYCSEHPTATFTVGAGKSFTSFATFPASDRLGSPFTLDWQPGQSMSGSAEGIRLR
ncbi:serine/threonine-protein kinase [Nocardioides sp. KR10-350]|uniref:serine/threonine-protein kinase n=1 Tax=Nocardioides cheoyonin TaxID=3156615 RepID=UPI0032B360E1